MTGGVEVWSTGHESAKQTAGSKVRYACFFFSHLEKASGGGSTSSSSSSTLLLLLETMRTCFLLIIAWLARSRHATPLEALEVQGRGRGVRWCTPWSHAAPPTDKNIARTR